MTTDEIRIRSLYLFLACSQAIDLCREQLVRTAPPLSQSAKLMFEKNVKKELGLLFRYWATQRIWKALDTKEPDAKNLNLALLRLFFDGLRLPKDGSGLRYAELLTLPEQVNELYHRVEGSLGATSDLFVKALQQEMPAWHAAVGKYTTDALGLPLETLSRTIKAWAEQ